MTKIYTEIIHWVSDKTINLLDASQIIGVSLILESPNGVEMSLYIKWSSLDPILIKEDQILSVINQLPACFLHHLPSDEEIEEAIATNAEINAFSDDDNDDEAGDDNDDVPL